MTALQINLTLAIFGVVVLLIVRDWIDMTLAALLGVSTMLAFDLLGGDDIGAAFDTAGGALALLFGGMVVARALQSTGLFEWLAWHFLRATRGSGRRFLLLIVAVVAPVCALLPNATTVILLAPIILSTARALKVDFVPPLVLAAIVSNSAGLLTLVGDPATFIVGSGIGMSFNEYLRTVSPLGLALLLAVVPLLRWLVPDVWRTRVELPGGDGPPAIEQPVFLGLSLALLALMVVLFIFGESLPTHIVPPEAAIIAASLALLLLVSLRGEPLEQVMRDIDWKTLVFIGAIFCMVQGVVKTGLIGGFALQLHDLVGDDFPLVALLLLASIGVLSSVVVNTPLVAAALVLTKGYLVIAEAVPESALVVVDTDWPAATLPMFVAMMFGGTLGGNATLIGASANVVSAGICAREGQRVTFLRFMRYGLPVALAQLLLAALFVVLVGRGAG